MISDEGSRVGVVGHRWNKISKNRAPMIRKRLVSAFERFQSLPLPVTLVTGMAEGTDLLAAEMRPKDWHLEAVLPLPFGQWRNHLATSAGAGTCDVVMFDRLINEASLVLPASHTVQPDFVWVAQHIVATCDHLVAIWDGRPGGPGGTADIIARARINGIAVFIIDSIFFNEEDQI